MTDTLTDQAVLRRETSSSPRERESAAACLPMRRVAAGARARPDETGELDVAFRLIAAQEYFAGMDRLVKHLRHMRLATSDDDWQAFVALQVLAHPVRDAVHRDPFTRRSFDKPRGFPGDAVLLDFIYGCSDTAQPPDPEVDPVACGVFSYTVDAPAPKAVRYRRSLIARLVDQTAERFREPRILSLACGHLREAELSGALQSGEISEWCAVDQDPECIEFLGRRTANCSCIKPVLASIREILTGKRSFAGYHLVYASGLFDYLREGTATALVERMLDATVPGGKVIVTNFLPAVHDVGYMESLMDWHLIFRSAPEVLGLLSSVPRSQLRQVEISVEPQQNIVFAIAQKR